MAVNPVLSNEVARRITGGRTPLVPAEYEQAIHALTACVNIDEAKYWASKADVYAAWARIFHSDEVLRKAKVLKLHAQRRMGELAKQLRPTKPGPGGGGAVQLLREHGFKTHDANAISAVARASKETFERAINARRPPSAHWFKNRGQPETARLDTVYNFARFCDKWEPQDLIEYVGNRKQLLVAAQTISEWADKLEQLMKGKYGTKQ